MKWYKSLSLLISICLLAGSPLCFAANKTPLFSRKQKGGAWVYVDETQTTGNLWFVDSGSSTGSDAAGYGQNPDAPFATIDYAVGQATANNGDKIIVMPGHTETITADSGIDLDVAGISVIGLGNGEDRPIITFTTATTADFKIAAANITVKGLVFKCNIASQAMMIEVTGDDALIEDCEFREGSATGLNFVTVGVADNDADRARILNNRFYMPTAGNGDSAISLAKDHAGVEIRGNYIYGDFDNAAIEVPAGGNAQVNFTIEGNEVINKLNGVHAIEINGTASTGLLSENKLVTDAYATAIDPGGLAMEGNLWNAEGDADSEAVLALPQSDQTSNYIGTDDNNNAAATTNVAVNRDGSILERLEDIEDITERATSKALASVATGDLFAVAGGPIRVVEIIGVVTGAIQNQTTNIKLLIDPTEPAADTDICAILDIDNDAAGTVYTITGTFANNMVATTNGVVAGLATEFIVPAGMIELNSSASSTGTITWYIRYIPLGSGVTVTAQ